MKKLLGFTLAEVMVTLTIIAVIILFYIPVHKVVRAQYTTLAYSAYEALSTASKELMSGDVSVGSGSNRQYALSENNGKLVLNPDTNSFCLCFADIMNLRGGAYCPVDENQYASISGNKPVEYKLNSQNWDEPNLIGTNGYKYYISSHHIQDDDVSKNYGYRVIAVDLTGNKNPNKPDNFPESSSGQPADIVYYLMLDDGSVFPIGIAASDRNYINTRTAAYYYSNQNLPESLADSKAVGCRNFTSGEGIQEFKDLIFNPNKYVINNSDSASVKKEKQHIHSRGCSFWKDSIKITDSEGEQQITYSFRIAYCLKYGQNGEFKGYNCTESSTSPYFPGVGQANECLSDGAGADECVIEPIKPLYKIKL